MYIRVSNVCFLHQKRVFNVCRIARNQSSTQNGINGPCCRGRFDDLVLRIGDIYGFTVQKFEQIRNTEGRTLTSIEVFDRFNCSTNINLLIIQLRNIWKKLFCVLIKDSLDKCCVKTLNRSTIFRRLGSCIIMELRISDRIIPSDARYTSGTTNKRGLRVSRTRFIDIKTSYLVLTNLNRRSCLGRCLNNDAWRKVCTISTTKISDVNISNSSIKDRCSSSCTCSTTRSSRINNIYRRNFFITNTAVKEFDVCYATSTINKCL